MVCSEDPSHGNTEVQPRVISNMAEQVCVVVQEDPEPPMSAFARNLAEQDEIAKNNAYFVEQITSQINWEVQIELVCHLT